MLIAVRHSIVGAIDFFHPPFSRWIKLQTFRYLACGGSNTVLDTLIYYIGYNYILGKHPIDLGLFLLQPYYAAFFLSFAITFPLGFALSKYIVFPESNLHGGVQLFRYAALVVVCFFLNFVFIKIFVEYCHFYPTPSKALTTGVVAIFSYFSQRTFTFKTKKKASPVSVAAEEVV